MNTVPLIINIVCFGLLGAMLASCGITVRQWQFYVILILAIIAEIAFKMQYN